LADCKIIFQVGLAGTIPLTMIVVTAISGAQNEDALCYLVEFDNEVKILLDCGWNDQFNVEDLKHLRRYFGNKSLKSESWLIDSTDIS